MSRAAVEATLTDILAGVLTPRSGLCDTVRSLHPHCDEWLNYCFLTWPLRSSNPIYPVASGHPVISPNNAFIQANNTGTLYDPHTAYGRARLNLVKHLHNNIKRLPYA